YELIVDLENQSVADRSDFSAKFQIDPFKKHCLLNALDDIGLTLELDDKIIAYESDIAQTRPYLSFPT
ncbi:MAG TPA: hypothetical protein VJL58_09110, partial [Pyrinomonadaceae bacterium]|nr:hypothetical protein [Pyrinomonadaceae bacterium]